MPMLQWSDDLSIHIDEVDNQHKSLVDMVNVLYDSMRSEAVAAVLFDIVEKMRDYAQEHFGTEERYMARYAYPDMASHQQEHADFIDKVRQVEMDCKSGKASLSMDILNFLSHWLVTHIHQTDKKMGVYLVKAMSQ